MTNGTYSVGRMGLHVWYWVTNHRFSRRYSDSRVTSRLKAFTELQFNYCPCRSYQEVAIPWWLIVRIPSILLLHKSKIHEETKLRTLSWDVYHKKLPSEISFVLQATNPFLTQLHDARLCQVLISLTVDHNDSALPVNNWHARLSLKSVSLLKCYFTLHISLVYDHHQALYEQ